MSGIVGDSIVKILKGLKLGRKVKQNVAVRSFPKVKLYCMSHYVIPTNKNNPSRIIIHYRTSNLTMDESPMAIAEKTIELGKNVK